MKGARRIELLGHSSVNGNEARKKLATLGEEQQEWERFLNRINYHLNSFFKKKSLKNRERFTNLSVIPVQRGSANLVRILLNLVYVLLKWALFFKFFC